VDSSALFAGANERDGHHLRATELLAELEPLVTSDHVLVETWQLLNSRISRHVAEAFWHGLRDGPVSIEPVGPADLELAWSIGEQFADQTFSIVDRTSFAVMRRLGIYRVASFDDDFAIYRFGPRGERAFEVLR